MSFFDDEGLGLPPRRSRMSLPTRPIQLTALNEVLPMISQGRFDELLDEIENAVKMRRQNRRGNLMNEIENIFGPEAVEALKLATGQKHSGQPSAGGCDDPNCKVPDCRGPIT